MLNMELETLKKRIKFKVEEFDDKIRFFTGPEFRQKQKEDFVLTKSQIEEIPKNFKTKDWFILGNNITGIIPGGFGEYVKEYLSISPKYASHIVAYMRKKGIIQIDYSGRCLQMRFIS